MTLRPYRLVLPNGSRNGPVARAEGLVWVLDRARSASTWATDGAGDAGTRGVEVLGRAGLVASGVLHLLLAGLAVVLMTGSNTVHADQEGAVAVIAGIGPVGAALLGLSILGLVAFGVWQVRAALIVFRWTRGGERTRKRIGAAGKAIARAALTGCVGVLFAAAALTDDPRRSGVFTHAMRVIEDSPAGLTGLVVVSGGLATSGIYCFIDAYARRA